MERKWPGRLRAHAGHMLVHLSLQAAPEEYHIQVVSVCLCSSCCVPGRPVRRGLSLHGDGCEMVCNYTASSAMEGKELDYYILLFFRGAGD
jgi:hypothetical protein